MNVSETVAFIDLDAQRHRLGGRVEAAIARVLSHGAYIMGPEVAALERELATFAGAGHAVTCGNGTDALVLLLRAWGVGPNDAVFVPAFTFVATAEAAALVGAVPVFVDVDAEDFNMAPDSLERAIEHARRQGLNPAVVVPVDLFGQPADYPALGAIARRLGLKVLGDGAQSFGGSQAGVRVGSLADATTTSFFPAKPLGCYGDGGAIFTNDDAVAAHLRRLRVHGQGGHKYENIEVGYNSRLDTVQAAVLLEKLAIFPDELIARQQAADRYNSLFEGKLKTPLLRAGNTSAWAQYTLVVENREAVARACAAAGVPTAVYYPIPLHRQRGYAKYPAAPEGCPVAEWLAERVISLPMHPYLDEATQSRVAAAVLSGDARSANG